MEKYLSCCTITGNISSEKSLARSDYFHAEFPLPPAMLFSSHVGLFLIQQAFYSSCYQGWILYVVFSSILVCRFFSPLSVLRSLDLAFTWDMTILLHVLHLPDRLGFTSNPASFSLLKQETQSSFHILSRALVPFQSILALPFFFFLLVARHLSLPHIYFFR